MLKLVPKYQKGKVLPTPQQAIDKGALAYSKLMDNYNRANAQANYRAARNAKFSKEQAKHPIITMTQLYNIWSKQLSKAWDTQDLFKYRRYQNGGSFTTGALTDMIWNRDNFPNQVKYGNGNYNNVNTALFSKYKPTGSDDRVKLINHPTYPKRGRFTKDGMKFYMSDFGMNNPNLTLFGAPDNYPDGQTTMIYKGEVVLPEITVTPTQRYIDNPYDQYKIYLKK